MIVRTLLAALCAGLLAGILILPVQYARVVPLIVHAESYENGGAHEHHAASPSFFVSPAYAHGAGGAHEEGEGGGTLVESRLLGTLLADLVAGAGFALLLAGASLVLGLPLNRRNGVFWGLAGFATVTLAPALGLAPELPAMPAAELGMRQAWWLATAAFTALGLFLLVTRRSAGLKAAGIFALLLPHLWGAPQPTDLASPVPPALAAEFAVASLVTSALFWVMIGTFAGRFLDRAATRSPLPA
ncbi:CbtA family protein [Aureimonas psammosilenae]|uniref:CbtA family protein n=1 Tax=Aureimonas psammosilenae TaxID=2495496 RepID=UPI001260FB72|nr:CbtA family protein [Aureimonas psammosilenae]